MKQDYNDISSRFDNALMRKNNELVRSSIWDKPKFKIIEFQEWKDDITDDIDFIIPVDCLARDIQLWILENSIYPQPAIAYVASLMVIGVCIGRNIRLENIKGNFMAIALLESGEGKDWPFKAVIDILSAVNKESAVVSRLASGAAFIEALHESPSMLFHIDEVGNYLAGIKGDKASVYAREIIDYQTEAYTSADRTLTGKRTKGNEAIVIKEPNVCFYGVGTERQVIDGVKTRDLADGSLARYFVVFGRNGLLPKRIHNGKKKVPDSIIKCLIKLIETYQKDNEFGDISTHLSISKDYDDAKWDIVVNMKKMANKIRENGGDKASFAPFYNRIAVRAVQQSMLIDQCTSVDLLKWIVELETKCLDVFMKKFSLLGSDNENESQAKLLTSIIKKSGKKGISSRDITRQSQKIQVHIRQRMLQDLVDSGLVHKDDKKMDGSQRKTTLYFWLK